MEVIQKTAILLNQTITSMKKGNLYHPEYNLFYFGCD